MKKLLTLLATAVTLIAACFGLAACNEEPEKPEISFTGGYLLVSATAVDNSGNTRVYRVGDTVAAEQLGNTEEMTLTADYQTLEVSEDGTFIWRTKFDMYNSPVYRGDWTKTENGYSFRENEFFTVYTAKFDEGRLSLTYVNNGVSDTTVFIKADLAG